MNNIKLYYHTGSGNHGCEAIVRGTVNILRSQSLTLFSAFPEDEKQYGVDKIVTVEDDREIYFGGTKLQKFVAKIEFKFFGKTERTTRNRHLNFFSGINNNDICLSIGGDNYTYDKVWQLKDYNNILNKMGAKTVLWGCSIDSELIPALKEDLNRYSLIVTRETMTYNALKVNNINTEIRVCPDPAFQLETAIIELPELLIHNEVVGINISPLILKYGNSDLILKNFESLFDEILINTDMVIALIPHVTAKNNDDRLVLQKFYEKYKKTGRVYFVEDQDCTRLKAYIGVCRFFIGARTHATIAAYSSHVPTVVVGYSMKANGIAQDIFGTYENYVCPVQNFTDENELTKAFQWLQANEQQIKDHYLSMMPAYKERAKLGGEFLNTL